jgi:succinoglycan biosynthesis transport protein ExoP
MGRIEKALQRAAGGAQDPAEPQIDEPVAGGSSARFDVTEGTEPQADSRPNAAAAGGALVVREEPLPVWRQSRPDTSDDIQLAAIAQTLSKRRWQICGVVLAFVAAAVAYNLFATPLYEAHARVIVDPDAPQVVTFRPVVPEDQWWTEDYFRTQIEVLRSRALAEKTLAKVGMVAPGTAAEPAQLNWVLRSLRVSPLPESRLVDVSFTTDDPTLAARVANAHAEAYVEQNLDSLLRPSRDASTWLTDRLAELRQQVDASQTALQRYREQHDQISLEERQNIVVQKLGQLAQAVTTARTERIAKQALLDQLRSQEGSGAPLDSLPPILGNTFIQQLKGDLAGLQRERARLSEQLGELHPDMVKLTTAIEETERRLDAEISRVVDGVRKDFAAVQANERGLTTALEEQQREVLALNRSSIGYGALQRDAQSTQQIFESVLQRFKEADLSAELQSNNIRILDAAVVPTVPIWPRAWLNLVVALIGGLVMAVGLALGREHLNRRVDSPEDLGGTLGVPLLGITPAVSGRRRQLEGPEHSVPAVFREALRGIRARILLSPLAASARVLVVTSAMPQEGKTVVTSHLAVSMARTGRRVLLVDGDMRRPRIHRLHNVDRSPGLSDVMNGTVRVGAALCASSVDGLMLLPAGTPVSNPADVLEARGFKALVKDLSDEFDLILIDSPPVMAVADASILANAASTALFVVGAGAATRETIRAAIDRLASVQAQVIGVVLNRAYADEYSYPYDGRDEADDDRPTMSASGRRAMQL